MSAIFSLFLTVLMTAFLIGAGVYLIQYVRVLSAIVHESNESGEDIFGARYKNTSHLGADAGFLNELWIKGCQDRVSSPKLSAHILKAHKLLRWGIYVSTGGFFGLLLIRIINISA